MASINQMFATVLSEGIKSSKAISDPEKKATACAELAKAIAMTGLVVIGDDDPAIEPTTEEAKDSLKEKAKPAKKESAKKETPKPKAKAKKEESAPKEVAKEEPASDPEVEISDEWTDETMEMFASELEVVQQLQEEYDEETIDECVRNFSEGVFKGIEDISPLNIKGFVAYMEMLLEDAEEAE